MDKKKEINIIDFLGIIWLVAVGIHFYYLSLSNQFSLKVMGIALIKDYLFIILNPIFLKTVICINLQFISDQKITKAVFNEILFALRIFSTVLIIGLVLINFEGISHFIGYILKNIFEVFKKICGFGV